MADDLNGDGLADLAVAGAGQVSVLINAADGAIPNAARYAAGGQLVDIVAAELDGTGGRDLAVASQDSNSLWVLPGVGDGTFTSEERFAVGRNPRAITVNDFNRDGKPDLAVANRESNDISLLVGRGDGMFERELRIATGGPTLLDDVGGPEP